MAPRKKAARGGGGGGKRRPTGVASRHADDSRLGPMAPLHRMLMGILRGVLYAVARPRDGLSTAAVAAEAVSRALHNATTAGRLLPAAAVGGKTPERLAKPVKPRGSSFVRQMNKKRRAAVANKELLLREKGSSGQLAVGTAEDRRQRARADRELRHRRRQLRAERAPPPAAGRPSAKSTGGPKRTATAAIEQPLL